MNAWKLRIHTRAWGENVVRPVVLSMHFEMLYFQFILHVFPSSGIGTSSHAPAQHQHQHPLNLVTGQVLCICSTVID